MKTVTLLPTTKRLKQLTREVGDQWVEVERRPVQCFGGEVGVFVSAGSHSRWVRETDLAAGCALIP